VTQSCPENNTYENFNETLRFTNGTLTTLRGHVVFMAMYGTILNGLPGGMESFNFWRTLMSKQCEHLYTLGNSEESIDYCDLTGHICLLVGGYSCPYIVTRALKE